MQEKNTSPPIQDTSVLKTTTSANPTAFSLKTTTLSFRATASTDELKCQPTSSSFLLYYQENNETYLCKTEMDLQLDHNNTSQSEEHVMVLLTMKAGNLSGWNISEFAFLNNTDLYTGPQNDQRLFYCYLPPDNSKCPDLKDELKCQPTSSSFLLYYQENNETARSAALPVIQTRKDDWWCVITSVWLALVLTVVVLTLLSVGNLIFKSRKRKSRSGASVPVSVRGHQLKELIMSAVPAVSIATCSISENLLKVADLTYKIFLYKTSLDEEEQNEDEEDEQCNASLQHLAAQGHCEPPTYLDHRSNFSCSGHEEDGEL
ncbi:uncharacterized protein [Sinocyclocheilus grahami]|uniref:uncharacterized protein n=1 Tax=Sinocyclocheilus grahami TaxID=75366 RepID=UPI0007AC6B31|nr:PREDICTED: uncharacterized protein LOC107565959 [Sinocyclocheilus grahami]